MVGEAGMIQDEYGSGNKDTNRCQQYWQLITAQIRMMCVFILDELGALLCIIANIWVINNIPFLINVYVLRISTSIYNQLDDVEETVYV